MVFLNKFMFFQKTTSFSRVRNLDFHPFYKKITNFDEGSTELKSTIFLFFRNFQNFPQAFCLEEVFYFLKSLSKAKRLRKFSENHNFFHFLRSWKFLFRLNGRTFTRRNHVFIFFTFLCLRLTY